MAALRNFHTFAGMKVFLIMGKFGVTEIVVILAIVLLLFGGRKIPELMRGLGRGVKEFKDGVKGEGEEEGKKIESK